MRHLANIAKNLRLITRIGLFLLASSASAEHLDPVTLQLKWQHQFQFAGYYAAQEKGFYREKGLDVRFAEAGPRTDVVGEVTSGRAQYGVGTSALLIARNAGKPVVALAVIFQHSPFMLYGHVYSGIMSIKDVQGKRVMLGPHAEELMAYLHRENIPTDSLKLVPHSFSIDDLVFGHVDAMSGFSTSEPFHLDKTYIPYVALSPRAAGIDFYGDNLFTSEAEIRNNPQRVKAFREASLKGWDYALAHPVEIAEIIRSKYAPQHSREFLLFEAERMRPLISNDLVAIGHMHNDRWQHAINVYAELGLVGKNFSLDRFLYVSDSEAELKQERLQWGIGLAIALVAGALATFTASAMIRLNRSMKREMAAREQAVGELRESESKFRFIAEHTADVIWILDIASGRFTYVSPSVYEMRGYTPDEVMAQPIDSVLTPESAERARASLAEAIARWNAGDHTSTLRVIEVDQPHRDGHIVHTEVVTTLHADAAGKPLSVIGVTRNITERKRTEDAIRRLAFYDPLTDLANRRLLLDRLPQQIARAERNVGRLAILYVDLDKFKPINDRLGHDVGDWLLKSAAGRLRGCLRQSDTAARVGGDEFVVLLPDIQNSEQALAVAEKINGELQRPFVTQEGRSLSVSSSIGIAVYPDHGTAAQELLRMADEAMYRAKNSGKGRIELFTPAPSGDGTAAADHRVIQLGWRPNFASNHPLIDEQHRELFRLANNLMDVAMASDTPSAGGREAFDALLAHIEAHFADEEQILRDHAYDALPEHIAEHRRLLAKAAELRRRADKKAIPIGELVDFLARDVVARHLLQDDRKYFGLFSAGEARPQSETSRRQGFAEPDNTPRFPG